MPVDPVAVTDGEEVVVLDPKEVGVLETLVLVDLGGFARDKAGAGFHEDVGHEGRVVHLGFLGGLGGGGFLKGSPCRVPVRN